MPINNSGHGNLYKLGLNTTQSNLDELKNRSVCGLLCITNTNQCFDSVQLNNINETTAINCIPSHVGIEGNELADAHAKEGLEKKWWITE